MSERIHGICAVLVTYHPDEEFPRRLAGILQQVGAMVMVDNGSTDAEVSMLRACALDPSIALILNAENLGVARALNIGIQEAASRGYSWVLLVDQDSRIESDLAETLWAIRGSFADRERLAIIGSNFWERHRHAPKAHLFDSCGAQWNEVETVITSGSLLSLAAYSHIGPFRDEFFIDYVDTEYCARARAKGYHVLKTRRPLMFHSIGKPTQHRMLWMKKWTSNHSADRRYYLARNHTVILRESGKYPLGLWTLMSFASCFRSWKRIALYERAKASKMAAVFLGWRDGVRGIMGPRRKVTRSDGSALNAP